jgi:ABC-2 type transport system ATP-binding protein
MTTAGTQPADSAGPPAAAPVVRVEQLVDLFASFYRQPAGCDELLAALGLADKRGVAFRKLSGGLKQRLSIALALVGSPRLAILDELTTGLDPQARRDTWELIERIRDRGVTVILVTHYMDEAEWLCDRVMLIDSGRVAALGTPAGLAGAKAAGRTCASCRQGRSRTGCWPRCRRWPRWSTRDTGSWSPGTAS